MKGQADQDPPPADTPGTPAGYQAAHDSARILARLKRAEGQVRGVAAMVEDGRYCIDVLQQISAVQAALDKVALMLVDDHVRHCVAGAEGDTRDARLDELMAALGRLTRR